MAQVCLRFAITTRTNRFYRLGYAFIKRVKEGSVAERVGNRIKAGDHIEKINEKSVVGIRHFEVAQLLKDIPVGSTFKIRLIEPNAFDFRTYMIPLQACWCMNCLTFSDGTSET